MVLVKLLIGFFLFLPSALASQSLVVRPHTLVKNSNDIYLIDIVQSQGLPESLKKSMRSVKLVTGPRLGERQVLSSDSLSRLIRKQLSQLKMPQKYRLKIPRQVIIENQGYTIKSSEVESQLQKQWATFCADCTYRVSQMVLPQLNQQLQSEWSIQFDAQNPKGQFSYPMVASGKTIGWVRGMVRVYKTVPVVTRSMQFGERLNKEDIQMAEKEITYSYDSPTQLKRAVGRRLKRALRVGDVIWTNSLEKNYATRIGEPVKMVIGTKDWSLSLQGIAQSNGEVGDTISVKNPKTNKILSATVVDDREVQVQ